MFQGGLGNLWGLLRSQIIVLEPTNVLSQIYNLLYNLLMLFAVLF
ncbi:MAG TPA: hypothetical protein PLD73_18840 [Candidatus Hydrogenedentes bacterium]|jgi:hypothetical protein|nr:hypothetical protein [Candidatus Hydrogenedentota bacterium]HPJ98001.1 hypothetical protein [Candidatus Hydrogenedentota bacterium]